MTFSRLLITLMAMLATAASLLHLRHERLVTRNQMAELHKDLQRKQSKLWRQQIDIATYASPQVLDRLAREQRSSVHTDLTAEPIPTPIAPGN